MPRGELPPTICHEQEAKLTHFPRQLTGQDSCRRPDKVIDAAYADQGEAAGQNNLGEIHYYGHGVKQDYAEALKWYQKAAEQGYASAQANLGYMYEFGQGVKKSKATAIEWYRKATAQGNENAKKNLKRLKVK